MNYFQNSNINLFSLTFLPKIKITLLLNTHFLIYCLAFGLTLLPNTGLNAKELTRKEQGIDSLSKNELTAFLKEAINQKDKALDQFDAQAWLTAMLNRMEPYKIDHDEALQILRTVYREANNSDLQPELVLSVIAIESSFKRFAVSRVGAQGLMQVMPFWKREIGRPNDNLMSIDTNIKYGCKILQFYMKKSNGNWSEALARYNGSYGSTVYSEKVLLAWSHNWRSGSLVDYR